MMDVYDSRSTPTTTKRRVLFIGEAATLAHVVRPFVLAQSLDQKLYEVIFACDPRYNKLLGDMPFPWRPIRSIPSEQFLCNVAAGRPLFDVASLRDYVAEDLALLRECKPDLIVGDMRLSLAISAPLTNTCYMAICNAYWSPYARQRFPVPDTPLIRFIGVLAAQVLFRLVRPLAFAYHALPVNRVRREHGLPSIGLDPRSVHSWGDYTLYPEIPELVPTFDRPDNHVYLGPLLWSPAVGHPEWWDTIPRDRPLIYLTMGSSGKGSLLDLCLQALADLPVYTIAATASQFDLSKVPANAFVADYLPGEEAASLANLVICNGGSPTTQQALAAGKPVLGLPSNMDQFLNMEAVARLGAGEFIRAGRAQLSAVRAAVTRMLELSEYVEAARRLGQAFERYHAAGRFRAIVAQALQTNSSPRPPELVSLRK